MGKKYIKSKLVRESRRRWFRAFEQLIVAISFSRITKHAFSIRMIWVKSF